MKLSLSLSVLVMLSLRCTDCLNPANIGSSPLEGPQGEARCKIGDVEPVNENRELHVPLKNRKGM